VVEFKDDPGAASWTPLIAVPARAETRMATVVEAGPVAFTDRYYRLVLDTNL
jgi:hypothetical protein